MRQEAGENCVTDIDGDWLSRCFIICRKQRICLNDDSLDSWALLFNSPKNDDTFSQSMVMFGSWC